MKSARTQIEVRRGRMKGVVQLIILSGVISGCSTTIQLSSPLDANRKINGGSATLTANSGVVYHGCEIQISRDSTRFENQDNDSLLCLAMRDLRSIEIVHHGGGAVEGLVFGGLGGLGIGLIAGLGKGSGGDEGMGRGLLALGTTVLGSVGGLIVGALSGHVITLIMPPDSVGMSGQLMSRHRGEQ